MKTTAVAIALILSASVLAQAQSLPPSPDWARAMPPGPESGVKITEEYARLVARDAYFWAWPMVNIYNKRLAYSQAPEPGLMGGIVPIAPVNRMAMLHDYIDPRERLVACPNQDVVYGAGVLALHGVHPGDHRGAGQARPLDHGDADAAAADDGDRRAGLDPGGVDHRADPGHHPAADERGDLVRHVAGERHRALGRHDHLLGEGPAPGQPERGGAADQEPRLDVGGDDVGHAQPRLAAQAGGTGAARRQPAGDDPVPHGQAGDAVADGDDVARSFVPEDSWQRLRQPAVAGGQVRVAHPGGPDLDLDLARPRADGHDVVAEVELGVLDRVEYRGPHDPPPAVRMRGDLCWEK